jgi:hypothetical protein
MVFDAQWYKCEFLTEMSQIEKKTVVVLGPWGLGALGGPSVGEFQFGKSPHYSLNFHESLFFLSEL